MTKVWPKLYKSKIQLQLMKLRAMQNIEDEQFQNFTIVLKSSYFWKFVNF